ncbi:MAG TPA: peptidylprolyl isomerase [Candidatus Krumholzibacteria bacterium]|nr:peptidylprolyl isomerase [Candidatus Krumholzibacteria bacterium]
MPRKRPSATARPAAPFVLILLILAAAGCGPDAGPRLASLAAIARWQDVRLAPADSLGAALSSPDAHVRLAAVRAAGLIGRNDARTALVERLGDRSLTVRREACFALGVLGDTLAVPALEGSAADRNPSLRVAALRGLAQVPNRGAALLAAAASERPDEAAAAWDGLRNQADRVPRDALLAAFGQGLAAPHADVQWRALRCAERLPDPSLLPAILVLVKSPHVQVRVHALRALARIGGDQALRAALEVAEHQGRSSRDADRVAVAAARALGALGAEAADAEVERVAACLIAAAGSASPHVAQAALESMAGVVAARPLPAEAAAQESLLPVWRIRLARAARADLDHPDAGPRAAAARAWAALRGPGGEPEILARLAREDAPVVAAALVEAAVHLDADPVACLAACTGAEAPAAARRTLARAAGVDALADRAADVDTLALGAVLAAAAGDADPVVAATAAARLGDAPCPATFSAMLAAGNAPGGPWRGDLVLGALTSCEAFGAAADSTHPAVPAAFGPEVAAWLGRCFDDPDVRIRLRARAAALATGVLPAASVPSEPSLRATVPAVVRDPAQPAVATPFKAPRLKGTTPRGEFEITLRPDVAPNTCAMVLDLVRRGFYDDLTFHRIVPDFVVQGGDPTGTGWGGPGYTIRSEWSPLPYQRGAVGIAHSGKDTGGSQWFVTLSEQPHLVGRYTVFGQVTGGMGIFDAMQPGDTFTLRIEP